MKANGQVRYPTVFRVFTLRFPHKAAETQAELLSGGFSELRGCLEDIKTRPSSRSVLDPNSVSSLVLRPLFRGISLQAFPASSSRTTFYYNTFKKTDNYPERQKYTCWLISPNKDLGVG